MKTEQQLEQIISEATTELKDVKRTNKAKNLVDGVIILDSHIATVQSESGNVYEVNHKTQRCECPDHKYRGTICKHIRAVNMHMAEMQETEEGQ